jgi:fatty acid CoA ligase FadD9
MGLAPRVAEMLYQHYQSAVDRHVSEGAEIESAEAHAQAELQSYEVPVGFLIETAPFSEDNGLLSGVGKLLRTKLK